MRHKVQNSPYRTLFKTVNGHAAPDYMGLWKLLYDWQTIITGGLAILAALIGGGMTSRAGVFKPTRHGNPQSVRQRR